MTRMENTRNLCFKVAHTEIIRNYNININISMTEFIENIKNLIYNDLQMENIEIVPTGQPYIRGRAAEDAVALLPSQDSVYDYFRERINFTSFYIRKINNENQESNISVNANANTNANANANGYTQQI
jgi:hypothetical protein